MKQGIRAKRRILRHWWISVRSEKAELYSEVTLWKMIQDHAQYLLNKDHQHHKWQPQKSCTLYGDYQDAQDKQQMQYPLIPRSKWKMHRRCWKSQSQNVPTFGYVCQNTIGRNHGPVWKIQSFLLSEICTVILWQDCNGKGNLRNSYWSTVGIKFQIGNVSSLTENKDYSYRCMWKI